MDWKAMLEDPTALTIAVIALLIAKKVLDLLAAKVQDQLGLKSQDGLAMQRFAAQCSADPEHFAKVSRIDSCTSRNNTILEDLDDGIKKGNLSCAWNDRDEINGLKQSIRDNTIASRASASAIKELTVEIRRNGNGR